MKQRYKDRAITVGLEMLRRQDFGVGRWRALDEAFQRWKAKCRQGVGQEQRVLRAKVIRVVQMY